MELVEYVMDNFPIQRPSTRPIQIEVDGEPLGVLVAQGEAYRFVAVRFPVFAIDGQSFASVEDAVIAAGAAARHALESDGA